jgi:hypothetical protein
LSEPVNGSLSGRPFGLLKKRDLRPARIIGNKWRDCAVCGRQKIVAIIEWDWCGRGDLNPHGLTPNGFSYPYGFRRLDFGIDDAKSEFVVWTIPSP